MSADNRTVAPDVCVRPAAPADFESLHEVDGRVFGELAYPYFTLRQLFDAFPNCWLVAASRTELVGYSFGVPSTDHTYAWLFGLAVDPNHRGRGHGTRLTRETLHLLGAMGVEQVYLTVEPANDLAIRLYRKFGFQESGYRKNYFGPGDHRLVMARRMQGIPTPRPRARP
jgi:[ribosomal protein S18]-alanine N-acetyltransferase